MSQEDIESMNIPAADNAILFLWATAPKLREALATMERWEFNYKTHIVWVKDKIGTGYYARGSHELLLIGEKGDMPVPEESNRPKSTFEAPRQGHSEKPDIVYDMIEKMYPNRKYLELFARKQQHSDKWTVWGNEMS
jgi:N6-adenosine-specific RNA methylase IME4